MWQSNRGTGIPGQGDDNVVSADLDKLGTGNNEQKVK